MGVLLFGLAQNGGRKGISPFEKKARRTGRG
jgi:hypothetical protein